MIKLRDYQIDAINSIKSAISKKSRALVVAPTGAGKTAVFVKLCDWASGKKPDIKILVLVNRIALVEQTEEKFKKEGQSVGVFCGTIGRRELDKTVTVAMIQSIDKIDLHRINLVILDEVHNVTKSQRYLKFLDKIDHDGLKIVAFTATPFNKGGLIYGKDKMFLEVDFRIKMKTLIDLGYLVKPSLKKPDDQFDISSLRVRMGEYVQEDVDKITIDEKKALAQVKDALPRLSNSSKVIWQCASIKHADLIHGILSKFEQSSIVHSGMSMNDRNENLKMFMSSDIRHLVFVTIVAEGFDYPPIDAVVLIRPIKSPNLYVQCVGRALRISEGKTGCLVLDYGKVVESLGPVDSPIVNDKMKLNEEGKREAPVKACPKCAEYIPISSKECPVCGYVFPIESKTYIKPEIGKSIISYDPIYKWENVDCISFRKYISRAGNHCLAIDFQKMFLGFNQNILTEFFSWSSVFSKQKAERRLWTMGIFIEDMDDLDNVVEKLKVMAIPKPIMAIRYEEKKFREINQVAFTRIGTAKEDSA